MSKCPFCGERVEANAIFCKCCGKRIYVPANRPIPRKRKKRRQRMRIIIVAVIVSVLCMCAALTYYLVSNNDTKQVYKDFYPIAYTVIDSDIDEYTLGDQTVLLPKSVLEYIESVDTSRKLIELKSDTPAGVIPSDVGCILPPCESFPFGFAFYPRSVRQEESTIVLRYSELTAEDAMQDLNFKGSMLVDMGLFKPAYEQSAALQSNRVLSNAEKYVPCKTGTYVSNDVRIATDTDGYIFIDLGKLPDSGVKGKIKFKITNNGIEFDGKKKCVAFIDVDYVLSGELELKNRIKKDILLGSFPLGIGVDGLAGFFINVVLRIEANGSAQLSIDGTINTNFGIENGEVITNLDNHVNKAGLSVKAKGGCCIGIRAEAKVLQTSALNAGIYGGVGFEAKPENGLKCYDIKGYLSLYGEIGSDGWFTKKPKRSIKLSIYDKENATLDSLCMHYEVENGIVPVCSYKTTTKDPADATPHELSQALSAYAELLISGPQQIDTRVVDDYSIWNPLNMEAFGLVDWNGDGIPELIAGQADTDEEIRYEHWGIEANLYMANIYTFQDGEVLLLGTTYVGSIDSESPNRICITKEKLLLSFEHGNSGYQQHKFGMWDMDDSIEWTSYETSLEDVMEADGSWTRKRCYYLNGTEISELEYNGKPSGEATDIRIYLNNSENRANLLATDDSTGLSSSLSESQKQQIAHLAAATLLMEPFGDVSELTPADCMEFLRNMMCNGSYRKYEPDVIYGGMNASMPVEKANEYLAEIFGTNCCTIVEGSSNRLDSAYCVNGVCYFDEGDWNFEDCHATETAYKKDGTIYVEVKGHDLYENRYLTCKLTVCPANTRFGFRIVSLDKTFYH